MKAIIILNYASEEDISKKTSIRLKNEENEWVEEVVIKPMPQPKKITREWLECEYENGWNDCLEEIENESRMD